LNNEIDKIIAFKTNRIGLKKLPAVDKNLLQTQDIKLLQLEVDNLRKRLDQLHHDNDSLKERTKVNHMIKAKELEDQLAAKRKSTPI
jgi:regulator of replication initiation timing